MVRPSEPRLFRQLRRSLKEHTHRSEDNLTWLEANMNPYFFITMAEEEDALVNLLTGLHTLPRNQRILLQEREDSRILACLNTPGSFYESLRRLQERAISYTELTHSYAPLPGGPHELEIQRYEFACKSTEQIQQAGPVRLPGRLTRGVAQAMGRLYPEFPVPELASLLRLLWLNDEHYARISPPERIARLLWLYHQGRSHEGLFLDVENSEDVTHHRESRLLFSVGNPQEKGFLAQVMEVFHRLQIGVRRAYCLSLNNGVHPYFLGTFYITTEDDQLLVKDSDRFRTVKRELYNTQILPSRGPVYTEFLAGGVMSGEDASLVHAMIAFCHTNLSHNQPDRFDLAEVQRAFYANPDIALQLTRLFRERFDPWRVQRDYETVFAATRALLEGYNTGHRHLDEVRRTIFRTALLLVHHTLKTNFFVSEKHALAFRLDPAYLNELGKEFTGDLPEGAPFRITFFFGRYGCGYHVGFSDIARGGWRTIICGSPDDYASNANTLLREVYVLAHTQHLKNKDIYEGGSKMVVVLDAAGITGREEVTQRLYKCQYGFINAFLDIFVTENGAAWHKRVVDYYREDEPIELGPDENMHDSMVELIARQSERRGYVLGKGVISSKEVGINHKEFGVTSLGVVTFAEITLGELGIDARRSPFSVKLTGGTNGDVAGNAMRLLLERCPKVEIRLVVAGAGALYDPRGLDRAELARLLLKSDVDRFDPARLSPGGFILFRRTRRQEGLRELFRKVVRSPSGVDEQWVTSDEFHREFDDLIFRVPADLFIPAGGRPETIDDDNWERMFDDQGQATCRAVVEGANSFLTPRARDELQERGVVVIRDASANKCGVISSSYEIIANLLMTDAEFLANKKAYVADVLRILAKRAEDEARLIFRRKAQGARSFTEISAALSSEMNSHYERLFRFFSTRPELVDRPRLRRVLLAHLPAFLRENRKFRLRIKRLPVKYRCAMLASELASTIVYRGGWEVDLETEVTAYAKKMFP